MKYSAISSTSKPKSAYPLNFGESVTTAEPVERFSPKVARHQCMLG